MQALPLTGLLTVGDAKAGAKSPFGLPAADARDACADEVQLYRAQGATVATGRLHQFGASGRITAATPSTDRRRRAVSTRSIAARLGADGRQ
jgi:hypothetical protein